MTGPIHFDHMFFRARVGLYTCLKSLGIGEGDEVALQAFTCVAVPEAIQATGAKPVYIDTLPTGVTIDPASLKAHLSPRLKAVIMQHTYGIPALAGEILSIVESDGIAVLEDCAHTYWSELQGRRVGTFGLAAAYSLDWGKPFVAGVGGGLVLNDDRLRDPVALRAQALTAPSPAADLRMRAQYLGFSALYHPNRYWKVKKIYALLSRRGVAEKSFNDLSQGPSAEFGLQILPSVGRRVQRKMKNFRPDWAHVAAVVDGYRRGMQPWPAGVREIAIPADARVMYQRFPLWVEDKAAWLGAAKASGVELSDWFETPVDPLGPEEYGQVGYTAGSCPNAELAARHIVSFPCNRQVTPRWAEWAMRKVVGTLASRGHGVAG